MFQPSPGLGAEKKINYIKERAYEECGDKAMLSPLPPAFISTVMELSLCEKKHQF